MGVGVSTNTNNNSLNMMNSIQNSCTMGVSNTNEIGNIDMGGFGNDIDIKQTLFNMTYEYPDCVTFLFKNSDDYFFGSTPEKVFNYNNGILITDALAGSIPNKGQKEDQIRNMFNNSILQKEHKIVVEFLENQLLKISNNNVKKSKLKIKSLSNVNHLLLELETNVEKNNFFEFINLLHPSPALA